MNIDAEYIWDNNDQVVVSDERSANDLSGDHYTFEEIHYMDSGVFTMAAGCDATRRNQKEVPYGQ